MAKPNFSGYVQRAKEELLDIGVDPDVDDCYRFAVVNLAALWIAAGPDPDVGVLYKPGGTNCRERATDILCWKDGTIVDCLGAGPDGPNTVLWQENADKVDPSRWRAPDSQAIPPGLLRPGPRPGSPPAEVPQNQPQPSQAGQGPALAARLDRLEAQFKDLQQQQVLLSNQLAQWVADLKVSLRHVPWPTYQGTSKAGKVRLEPVPPEKVG